MLLVREQRGEGVDRSAEVAIDLADEFGQVGAADGLAGLLDKDIPGGLVFQPVTFYGGGEVLVAEVEHGKADVLGLLGDAGPHFRPADSEAAAAGGEQVIALAADVEAEEMTGLGIAAEH